MAFLLHGVPVTHLDNNKILALNIQGANARLPPAPDQDTRSLASWSVLACWRPRGTLVEACLRVSLGCVFAPRVSLGVSSRVPWCVFACLLVCLRVFLGVSGRVPWCLLAYPTQRPLQALQRCSLHAWYDLMHKVPKTRRD